MNNIKSILGILLIYALILTGCSSSPDWVHNFVVWNDYTYVVSDEYTESIGDEIGKVTRYSDREGSYYGNFSNVYKKGTKYFEIEGISTDEAIAIEEDGKYRIANQNGKYERNN